MDGSPTSGGRADWTLAQRCSSSARYPKRRLVTLYAGASLQSVFHALLTMIQHSLQDALYEPALEYYTNHSKRVRRKRNRHSQSTSSFGIPVSPTAVVARPLRPEGWTVRYEYKMACFAEFRGEDEVALKCVFLLLVEW